MPTAFSFGSFNMNDNVNYFLLEKDNYTPVPINQTLYKIGRLEGMKKTGQTTNDRTINVKLKIIGTSRTDLENKIDALLQALALQQQHLTLHTNDSRYFIADCIACKIATGIGNVVSTTASLTFLCQQPYAPAASSSTFTSGPAAMSTGGTNIWVTGTITVAGGGNIYTRPTLVITANTLGNAWTQLQIQQTTDSQFLTLTSNLPAVNGDTVTIVCDPNATNGFLAYKNNNPAILCTLNGVFPVLEPTNTTWIIKVTSGASTPTITVQWTYTSRWLG